MAEAFLPDIVKIDLDNSHFYFWHLPMAFKTTIFIIISLLAYALSDYYSDRNTSQRELSAMFDSANSDLRILENYLNQHKQQTDKDYNRALQLAAELDIKHLDKIVDHYSKGNLVLNFSIAQLILQQLPSKSVDLNYAAGRIYSSNEYNQYDLHKAVNYLEFAALRGNANAAANLSEIYEQSKCNIQAITWAKQANKRAITTVCNELPVDVNQLSEAQWNAVVYNEDEFKAAYKEHRLPELHYSDNCNIKNVNNNFINMEM